MKVLDGQVPYLIAHPQVTAEEFDGEFVVLNLESGQYFSLANGAALIWRGLAAGCTPDYLASELAIGSPARKAFEDFVLGTISAGLIQPSSTSSLAEPSDLPRQIAASGESFELEAFDDLAALLVADPIHDVEKEAGWPHRGPLTL